MRAGVITVQSAPLCEDGQAKAQQPGEDREAKTLVREVIQPRSVASPDLRLPSFAAPAASSR
jgi:hypothetical protein